MGFFKNKKVIDRDFIITYLDSEGRLVHRSNSDGRWYWMDLDTWRRLPRRPLLDRRWA